MFAQQVQPFILARCGKIQPVFARDGGADAIPPEGQDFLGRAVHIPCGDGGNLGYISFYLAEVLHDAAVPELNAHRVQVGLGGLGRHKIVAARCSAGAGYTVRARSQVGDQLSAKLTRHGYRMQQLTAIADIGGILGHIGNFVRHGGKQLPQGVKGAAAGSTEQHPAVMQAAYLVKHGAGQFGLPLRQQGAVQIAGN